MKQLNHRVVVCPRSSFSRLTFAAGGEQATVARCLHGTAFIIPTPMETGLKDRVAIIAASSQGIGRATAEAFAAEGCRIAMCARNATALETAAEEIRRQQNREVLTQAFDVTDAMAVHQFVASVVQEFGSADICVTNAGGPPAKGFLAASIDEWKKALDANFLSTVYFAREVIPHMQKKKWGRIITITSITTKQPVADLVLSNAVRAAVVGLVKSLANEFGKDGILIKIGRAHV